jgi:hypothetical protein
MVWSVDSGMDACTWYFPKIVQPWADKSSGKRREKVLLEFFYFVVSIFNYFVVKK